MPACSLSFAMVPRLISSAESQVKIVFNKKILIPLKLFTMPFRLKLKGR